MQKSPDGGRPILGQSDPDPVMAHGEDRTSPFLIVCDHAGNAVPRALGNLGLSETHLQDHIAWDLHAWPVAAALADRLAAPLFGQAYSRLVIDCNRQPTAADSVPAVSDAVTIPGNTGLTAKERAHRVDAILMPYQNRIARHLREAAPEHARCIISVHSFTPALGATGQPRPWHVGVISGDDKRMHNIALAFLRDTEPSLVIGDNEPYSVNMTADYTLPIHAEPVGIPYVEFELRSDLLRKAEGRDRFIALLERTVRHAFVELEEPRGTIASTSDDT